MHTTVAGDFAGGVYANFVKFELGLNDAKLDFFLVSSTPDAIASAPERAEVEARLVARVFLPHSILRKLAEIIEAQVQAFSSEVFEIPDSSAAAAKLTKGKNTR